MLIINAKDFSNHTMQIKTILSLMEPSFTLICLLGSTTMLLTWSISKQKTTNSKCSSVTLVISITMPAMAQVKLQLFFLKQNWLMLLDSSRELQTTTASNLATMTRISFSMINWMYFAIWFHKIWDMIWSVSAPLRALIFLLQMNTLKEEVWPNTNLKTQIWS